MTSEELYEELLGIRRPWHVQRVALRKEIGEVEIWLGHEAGERFQCPQCGQKHSVYDHGSERRWRHLNSCEYRTYVRARLPRMRCGEMVLQVNAPWAEGSSRFTLAMECWCIDVLGECEVSSAGRLTGLEWHSMWLLMEHAVSRGKARKKRKLPSRIGVDEKSFAKRHKYETLICDLDKSTVEHVAEGRCQESLEGYLVSFTEEERQAVTAVALDMWDPYIAALRAKIPDADEKLVFDRYHVMTQVTKAVDQIRKQEHRELQEEGDERLSKTKYLWLSNRENVPRWKRAGFAELRKQKLKVGRAWSIKEALRTLWDYARYGWAKKFLKRWYFWASHSRLGPMIKAGRTIKRYQKGVLNYIHHGITNAAVEGLNSKIETIKRMACGYRNRQNYRTAIYFHLGGLNLYPEGEWGPSLHLGGTH